MSCISTAGGTRLSGATTVGSAVWGKLSALEGLPIAYFVAAACLLLAVPLTWRWKLQTGVGIDFSPATHWRAATITRNVANNRGPVLAVVEYRVDAANRAEFLAAVDELGHARRRDGAYAWGALSRCHAKSASGLRLTHFQAAATASRHVVIAAARSTR